MAYKSIWRHRRKSVSMELVYHTEKSSSGSISPFDEKVESISTDSDLIVISPYLNLNYVKRVVEISSSCRILTDLNEWIDNSSDRQKAQQYVREHEMSIRSIKDLHAKVVASENSALIGSANLTKKGMTRRRELSVYIEEQKTIDELRDWFEQMWSEAGPIDISEVNSLTEWSEKQSEKSSNEPDTNSAPSVSSDAPEIWSKSKLLPEESETVDIQRGDKSHLIERVGKAPNKKWMEEYLELAREVLEVTGFTNDSPELVMSAPKSSKRINVTVGHRYVLTCSLSETPQIGLILPENVPEIDTILKENEYWEFEDAEGDSEGEPYYVKFAEANSPSEIIDGLRKYWRKAISDEVGRYERAPRRKYHNPAIYRAVKDEKYRKNIFDEAF